jgi:peroxiredoxin/predicted 2-oxoglutarate/Fe(II)-dependent dioxygenase YbiX
MNRPEFRVGDPAPGFTCPATNNPEFHFTSAAGRYLVLCFFGSAGIETSRQALDAITGELRPFFDDSKLAFFGVTIDPLDKERLEEQRPGIRYFHDFDFHVSRQYGAMAPTAQQPERYHAFTLVLDPSLRVIATFRLQDPQQHTQRLRAFLETLPPVDAHAGVALNAPVLIVPRVFEPDFCRTLIGLYDTHGGTESGSMIEKDGATVGKIDPNFKRRRDYTIEDETIRAQMRYRLNRRLLPEIHKAFQFEVTHIERYIVACYDGANSGFFRAHRDNTTRGTAHRRFACTINLNAEEYEGGNLRFPEFGNRLYRAPTGGAVVFSCSLLHEAMPVTSGRRYVTLPFLYDAAAAKIRAENLHYLSGEVMDLRSPAQS